MTRLRLLILLASLCLVATACPDAEDEAADNDATVEEEAPAEEEPEPDDDVDPDEPADDTLDEEEPADDDIEEEEPADEDMIDEEEPADDDLAGPIDLMPSDPYLEDLPLDTTTTMELAPDGTVVFTGGENLRSGGWHGLTVFVTAPDGSEAEVQCSVRPDEATFEPSCMAFVYPNFNCGGMSPFDDVGTGPLTVPSPFEFDPASGTLLFAPAEVPDSCDDMTGATATGGFAWTCDEEFVCSSAVFADGFESGDLSSWSTP